MFEWAIFFALSFFSIRFRQIAHSVVNGQITGVNHSVWHTQTPYFIKSPFLDDVFFMYKFMFHNFFFARSETAHVETR